jgi:dienelactone hydrolase
MVTVCFASRLNSSVSVRVMELLVNACSPARVGKAGIVLLGFLLVLRGTSWAGPPPDDLHPGEVIEAVPCKRFPGQSYALYLPAAYTPQKSWPIVYAFDPGAQGDIPVRRYHDVAEKYGYILAGSNNSQNFLGNSEATAIEAILADTEERFSLDPKRIYTTGFSGGARVATLVALRCTGPCKVAGVMASGATYPTNISPTPTDSFLYFMALGDTDFNYPEFVQTRLAKERLGSPYRLRMFPEPHQWAPASVFEEAVAWFQLGAMRSGTIPKDEAFIAEQRKKTAAEATQAEAAHDSLRAFFAYKSLVEDFQGLGHAADAESKLESLKRSPELKRALEKERTDVETQQRLEGEGADKVARLSQNPTTLDLDLRSSILTSMQRLRRNGQNSKDEGQRRIYLRAESALFAQIVEEGQRRKMAGKFSEALSFFELLSEASPDRAWPPLLIAETRAAMGDHKRALKALRQAANTGHLTAQLLQKDQDLAPLFSDPEFQKIVEDLNRQPPKSP